jgi:hypothetical protein
MDKVTSFLTNPANLQPIIIVVLVIVIIYLLYRERKAAPKGARAKAKPDANNLLDELEQSGAVTQQSDAEETKAEEDE